MAVKNLLLQAFIKGLIMMMKMTMTMMLIVEIRDDVEDDDLLRRKGYTMMMVMVMTMIMTIIMRLTTFTGEKVTR